MCDKITYQRPCHIHFPDASNDTAELNSLFLISLLCACALVCACRMHMKQGLALCSSTSHSCYDVFNLSEHSCERANTIIAVLYNIQPASLSRSVANGSIYGHNLLGHKRRSSHSRRARSWRGSRGICALRFTFQHGWLLQQPQCHGIVAPDAIDKEDGKPQKYRIQHCQHPLFCRCVC